MGSLGVVGLVDVSGVVIVRRGSEVKRVQPVEQLRVSRRVVDTQEVKRVQSV